MSGNTDRTPDYGRPASSDLITSDPPVQTASTAAIEAQEAALSKYQDAVDTFIAAAEIDASPAVDEAASKDRRSALIFSSILIVLASDYASLSSAHDAGDIKITDTANIIKEINSSFKHILFLLLALSTYYLISFLAASYRTLKRWDLRRQAWRQRAASLVKVPYQEAHKT